MHTKLMLIVTAGLLAAPVSAQDATKDKKALKGTWVIVSAMKDGKPYDDIRNEKLVVDGDTMIAKSKKKEEKATYELRPEKNPKEIDVTEEGEKKILGIYSLDGDTLKLCFPVEREGKRPTELASKEGSMQVLIELKREKD